MRAQVSSRPVMGLNLPPDDPPKKKVLQYRAKTRGVLALKLFESDQYALKCLAYICGTRVDQLVRGSIEKLLWIEAGRLVPGLTAHDLARLSRAQLDALRDQLAALDYCVSIKDNN